MRRLLSIIFLSVLVTGCVSQAPIEKLLQHFESNQSDAVRLAAALAKARTEQEHQADIDADNRDKAEVRKTLSDPVDIPVEGSPSVGPEDAPLTVVAFLDFECPYSAATFFDLTALQQKHAKAVRLVFKHYPLTSHRQSRIAAVASEIAKDQDKFWPFARAVFHDQDFLSYPFLKEIAAKVGLDLQAFDSSLQKRRLEYVRKIEADVILAKKLEVSVAPTIFLNGIKFEGHLGAEKFERLFSVVEKSAVQ
jgi:protein-disulfide isomerase